MNDKLLFLNKIFFFPLVIILLSACSTDPKVVHKAEEVIEKKFFKSLIKEQTKRVRLVFSHTITKPPYPDIKLRVSDLRKGEIFNIESNKVKVTRRTRSPGKTANLLMAHSVLLGALLPIQLWTSEGRDALLGSPKEHIQLLEKQGLVTPTGEFKTIEYPIDGARVSAFVGKEKVGATISVHDGTARLPLWWIAPTLLRSDSQNVVIKVFVKDETKEHWSYKIPRSSFEPQLAEIKIKLIEQKRLRLKEQERERLRVARLEEQEAAKRAKEAARLAEENRKRQELARRAEEDRKRQEAALKAEKTRKRQEAIRAEEARRRALSKPVIVGSGSGFVISKEGYLLTNQHVVDGCKFVTVHLPSGIKKASVLATDDANDLALLEAELDESNFLPISTKNASLLDDVVVAGYPFSGILSTSVKVTKGIVSSLAGLRNDSSRIQFDAAIQVGNSGGPVLNDQGNVIAVSVSTLNKELFRKRQQAIPENTNFGIKSSTARTFVEANGIELPHPYTQVMAKKDMADLITKTTHLVGCWVSRATAQKMASDKKQEISVSPTVQRQVEALQ